MTAIEQPRRVEIRLEYERRVETVIVLAPGRSEIDVQYDEPGPLGIMAAQLAWVPAEGPPGRLELRVEAGREEGTGNVYRVEIEPPPSPAAVAEARRTRQHFAAWTAGEGAHPGELGPE